MHRCFWAAGSNLRFLVVVFVLSVFTLSSCGSSTPNCTDEKTVGLVKNIFCNSLEQTAASWFMNKSLVNNIMTADQISVTMIRTVAYDKKIGKYTCDAVIEAKIPEAIAEVASSPFFKASVSQSAGAGSVEIDGGVVKSEIRYTSQITDDKKQHLVELRGHKSIVDVVVTLGLMGAMYASKPQTQAAAPKTPQQESPTPASDVPPLQGHVNDYAGVLSETVKASMTAKLANLEETDSTQVRVLTVATIGKDDIDKFSLKVANAWGLGQKGLNNGVLVVLAQKEHRIRIKVGRGFEGKLTDLVSAKIIDDVMIPKLKVNDFDGGIADGVDQIVKIVKGAYSSTNRVHAQARTEAEIQKDLIKAIKIAISVYQKEGMAGLIVQTKNCYANVKQNGFYCVYLDLASRHIDQLMVAGTAELGMTFPKTVFFDDELFGSRIATVFRKANMDMETSNTYLRMVTPVINKLVEDNLLRKK